MQEQCIPPKGTLSLAASLLSSVLPSPFSFSEINMGYKLQRLSAQPIGMQTNEDIQTTICHILQFNTCNENSAVHQNQKSKRNSDYRFAHFLLCGGCALKLSTTYGHKIYRSTQGNQYFTSPLSPLSANWTCLAGNPCRKRKFWPDRHLWIRPSFPRPGMSNMRWIWTPNSYQNIEICSKHSWKKETNHSHWIQHQDPNKSNLGCFPMF